jgi:hypothetical protein
MRRSILFRSAVVLATISFAAAAPAQNTFSITGTFKMNTLGPTVGADLAAVYDNGNDHWWRLTLNGVSLSHDDYFDSNEFGYIEEFRTRVHAESFTFEFFGPDAAILNEVVGSQLVQGGAPEGSVLELVNQDYFDGSDMSGPYSTWVLRLFPANVAVGGVAGGIEGQTSITASASVNP